jgi:hypothetical protein
MTTMQTRMLQAETSADSSSKATPVSADVLARIDASLGAVQAWIERNDYRGYDPGDGLTSWARPLTFGNLFAERVLQQIIWKSPVNLRPILGIKPLDSTKGRGFAAWGYFHRYAAEGDEAARAKGEACLAWLDENRSDSTDGYCWGNHFDFSTRSGRMLAHQPTIVWSGLIGQAFLTAFEVTRDLRWLESANQICSWILSIPRERTPVGSCLSYVEYEQSSIHNSNALGAGLLARTWRHVRDERYLAVARDAFLYTCSRQNPDGSWFYGEEDKYRWIDSFHTGYVLDSLKRYIDATGDDRFRSNLERGYDYYRRTFFDGAGRPQYYPNKAWPIDIQCAAQAIDTFSFFSADHDGALQFAICVALWTIANMQDRAGFFHYRQYPVMRSRTAYFHWGQATMFAALSRLRARILETGSRTDHIVLTA